MANTLTALTPYLYGAAQEVSKEPVGALAGINLNFDNRGVAVGDVVYVPVAPAAAVADFAPAAATSEGTSKTAANVGIQIEGSKKTSWFLTGEQKASLANADSDKEWVRQLIAQGMRALRNAAEAAAVLRIKKGASRAYGTAGTTPFSENLSAITAMRALLVANGCPMTDMQCVVDPNAYLNLTNLGVIQQAAMAGSDAERRTGIVGRQYGFQFRETGGIVVHTKGTATGIDVNNGAGYVLGNTTIVSHGSDSGTVLAGDVVTWAGDLNKYILADDVLGVSVQTITGAAGGNVVINRPGLRAATLADAAEMTIGNNYTPNLAFERSAVVGVMRPPIIDENPTIKQMSISDDSGLTYLLLEIAQYGQTSWELHLAYGFKAVQPEHIGIILG